MNKNTSADQSRVLTLTATVEIPDFFDRPLTMREAVGLINDDGYLTATLRLDVDTFVEMRSDGDAFDTETDIYTELAALQVEGGDAYDASYEVVFFDPETNLIYVRFTTGLTDRLEGLGVDFNDPAAVEAFLSDQEG